MPRASAISRYESSSKTRRQKTARCSAGSSPRARSSIARASVSRTRCKGPGAERTPRVEAAQAAVGADEGLLGHVVGHLVPPHDAVGGSVHPPLVATDDLLEGKEAPPAGLVEQAALAFRRLGGHLYARSGMNPSLAIEPGDSAAPQTPTVAGASNCA